jgi:glucan phosphoethanolaminetransferase (alkaline phosphatase superfamily)
MIQRIQSIWMLLASITILLILFVPIAIAMDGVKEFWVQGTGLFQEVNGVSSQLASFRPLYIAIVLLGLMCFAIIFNFKNRGLQKKLCYVAILLVIGLAFWAFIYAKQIPGGLENAKLGVGAFLPVAAVLFLGLAIGGIKKDEQLLRSAERLR